MRATSASALGAFVGGVCGFEIVGGGVRGVVWGDGEDAGVDVFPGAFAALAA